MVELLPLEELVWVVRVERRDATEGEARACARACSGWERERRSLAWPGRRLIVGFVRVEEEVEERGRSEGCVVRVVDVLCRGSVWVTLEGSLESSLRVKESRREADLAPALEPDFVDRFIGG